VVVLAGFFSAIGWFTLSGVADSGPTGSTMGSSSARTVSAIVVCTTPPVPPVSNAAATKTAAAIPALPAGQRERSRARNDSPVSPIRTG
jgi:hypothetical protein